MQSTWREFLGDAVPMALAHEIDTYETQMALKRLGKLDDKLFAETRLRRGVYGQRYDNGQRHDGQTTRALSFPCGPLTKGPGTVWDAPGMQRIKIPYGKVSPEQLLVLADVAEEYSDGIAHVTTRQDFQLHFVHIDDTPDLMRRLAAAGITTREACGNTVRNVTGCPYAGVCEDEVFDIQPYADALTWFLLGHDDTQDFGRKFKISFSGCGQHGCGLAFMHDIGLIARERDGSRGFAFHVGGGLGSVPQQAKLFDDFVPEAELLPTAQAVCRVFARLGEKQNRSRARLKFLVAKVGLEEFQRLVREERASLPADPRWIAFIADVHAHDERPVFAPARLDAHFGSSDFQAWRRTNVRSQKQPGYSIATAFLPLGDLTVEQLRALADIAPRFSDTTLRTTVEQNILLRWVPDARLPALHEALSTIGLGGAGASRIGDITACPGTDTCKLGISSSRGLAAELTTRMQASRLKLAPEVEALHMKVSGCFNSCGQHHIADIGLLGVSRKVGGYTVPHFQVVLGGQWDGNAASYGLPIGAVPSKRAPEVIERLSALYVAEAAPGERFQQFIQRIGKARIRAHIEDLLNVPARADDASYYSDWGDPREYSISDLGVGECAGEVVPLVQFGLSDSESEAFRAQLSLERGDAEAAGRGGYQAMLKAARALLQTRGLDVPTEADAIVAAFREGFYDTKVFWDPFAGGKFAHYFFAAHRQKDDALTAESAHQRIEEAQLFIEAVHACYGRMKVSSQEVMAP